MDGARSLARKSALASLAIVALAAVIGIVGARRAGRPTLPAFDLRSPLLMSLFVPVGLASVGLAASLLVAPSFSGRNLGLSAPFVWLALGHVFAFLSRGIAEHYRDLAALLGLMPLVATTVDIGDRMKPWREEFRASAHHIAGLPSCAGQVVPVLMPHREPPQPGLGWYGNYHHYLRGNGGVRLSPLGFSDGVLDAGSLGDILVARSKDKGLCPVLGWTVHAMALDPVEAARAIKRLPGFDRAATVRVLGFQHHNLRGHFRPMADAFVIVVDAQR